MISGCLSDDALLAFLESASDEPECADADIHLRECPTCQAAVEKIIADLKGDVASSGLS